MVKSAVLFVAFLGVNFWFSFVIANRAQVSIASAIRVEGATEHMEDTKHAGLSMFSELGYINRFFDDGTYEPNWGERYFAEIVNQVFALPKSDGTLRIIFNGENANRMIKEAEPMLLPRWSQIRDLMSAWHQLKGERGTTLPV